MGYLAPSNLIANLLPMGMFRRIAKDQQRFVSSVKRQNEFSLALDLATANYVYLSSLAPVDLLESNMDKLVEQLTHTAKYRDETTKLNLHGECSVFAISHLRTFKLLFDAKIITGGQPPLNVNQYGCVQIHALNSDVRYLSWGVKVGTVSPDIFWEASDFLQAFKLYAIERLNQTYPEGIIPIPTLGTNKPEQKMNEFIKLFEDPIHYWKPSR